LALPHISVVRAKTGVQFERARWLIDFDQFLINQQNLYRIGGEHLARAAVSASIIIHVETYAHKFFTQGFDDIDVAPVQRAEQMDLQKELVNFVQILDRQRLESWPLRVFDIDFG